MTFQAYLDAIKAKTGPRSWIGHYPHLSSLLKGRRGSTHHRPVDTQRIAGAARQVIEPVIGKIGHKKTLICRQMYAMLLKVAGKSRLVGLMYHVHDFDPAAADKIQLAIGAPRTLIKTGKKRIGIPVKYPHRLAAGWYIAALQIVLIHIMPRRQVQIPAVGRPYHAAQAYRIGPVGYEQRIGKLTAASVKIQYL